MVATWWRRWPGANVGVRTGAVAGLVVVHIDPAHGGLESIRLLHAEHSLPDGLRVRTGSGGWHLYFAHPGFEVRNSAGTVLGDGVDVRGDGGHVIAPASRHITGGAYSWVGPWVIPDLPDHLAERIRPRSKPAPQPRVAAIIGGTGRRSVSVRSSLVVSSMPTRSPTSCVTRRSVPVSVHENLF